MHTVHTLYSFAVISYRPNLICNILVVEVILRSYTVEFSNSDLDISVECIKGKKPTSLVAIHMFC